MDKLLLKEIILEQARKIKRIEEGILREKLKEIKNYLKLPHTVVIAGIRRCGKSTLLSQVINNYYKDNYYYFNFEDERLIDFSPKDFSILHELMLELFGKRKTFFLDEIQNVAGWENFIRRMQDTGFKFFVTGSNASLLSKELGTKLTGRHINIKLYPFSFREFLLLKGKKITKRDLLETGKRADFKKNFNEYMEKGGMPEYLKYEKEEILKNIYEDILYRDIAVRYELKEIKALRELTLYLLSNVANQITFNKIKNLLKLGSVNTVKSYIDYLENSFLVFTANLFSYSLKKQLIAPKKVYCIDNGLINNIAFKFSKDKGRFLENIVFLELKRENNEIYYYKTKNNLEVDFLIKRGSKAEELCQVSWSLANQETKEREIKSLSAAMEELKIKKSMILTYDEEEELKIKGKMIIIKPVYKWLLEKE